MESLQFQKVEFSGPRCVLCQNAIDQTYFHLNGQMICPFCADQARAGQQKPSSSAVLRGFLYGAGAALLCAVGYAVFTLTTNMEFALISIAVGYVVGRAVRTGSNGLGGRRCQIMAVVLTYFAITISYVPLLIKAAQEQAKQTTPAQKTNDETAPSTQTVSQPQTLRLTHPVRAMILGMGVIAGLAVVSPFLGLANGISGFFGVLIIFFGLQQAWRQTARHERLLLGPYQIAPAEGA